MRSSTSLIDDLAIWRNNVPRLSAVISCSALGGCETAAARFDWWRFLAISISNDFSIAATSVALFMTHSTTVTGPHCGGSRHVQEWGCSFVFCLIFVWCLFGICSFIM